jgi:hypothetical protein
MLVDMLCMLGIIRRNMRSMPIECDVMNGGQAESILLEGSVMADLTAQLVLWFRVENEVLLHQHNHHRVW